MSERDELNEEIDAQEQLVSELEEDLRNLEEDSEEWCEIERELSDAQNHLRYLEMFLDDE